MKYNFTNINLKKSLSQNFLINKNTIKNIIFYLNLSEEETILEIGSGIGNITEEIYKKNQNITCIEIDNKLIQKCKNNDNINKINFINIDFLNFNFHKKYNKIFSSVPYHIFLPIIKKLLINNKFYDEIFLIIPEKIAKNIIDNKNSFLSFIISNVFKDKKKLLNIKNYNFFPKPKINSSLIKLYNKNKNYIDIDLELIRKIFLYKRKKIKFTIKKHICNKCYTNNISNEENIILFNKRIENINNIDTFKLYNILKNCNHTKFI